MYVGGGRVERWGEGGQNVAPGECPGPKVFANPTKKCSRHKRQGRSQSLSGHRAGQSGQSGQSGQPVKDTEKWDRWLLVLNTIVNKISRCSKL